MNKPSDDELETFFANHKPDTVFRANARLLQSKWREKKGILRDEKKYYGNFVEEKGCNFLTPKIWDIAQKEMDNAKKVEKRVRPVYTYKTFVFNLLSSQALCFNLFAEFLDSKDILVKIFNELKPDLMDKIANIKLEYSPGRQDKKYTDDGTAFDVFIEYEKNNEKSILGIEVKYSENLKEEKAKTAESRFKKNLRYKEITETCGLFMPNAIDEIRKPPYSQIWRDHLLSISLKSVQNYNNSYYVYLYPSNNPECCCGIKKYMNFLKNPQESIFELYLEDFVEAIKKYVIEPWADELFYRYIEGL
jgi:hypothetical protein